MRRRSLALSPPPPHTPVARARYAAAFPRGRSFIVAVRPTRHGLQSTLRAVEVARKGGADGVLLCNTAVDAEVVLALVLGLRSEHPDLWLGCHLTEIPAAQVLQFPGSPTLNGLMEEDAGVDSLDATEYADAQEAITEARSFRRWGGLHFGGVACHRPSSAPIPSSLLPRILARATTFVDVITVTGADPRAVVPPARAAEIREAVGDHPIAIASGLTPDNVPTYANSADCFVVCTGVESEAGVLDPARVRAFAEAVRAAPAVRFAPAASAG